MLKTLPQEAKKPSKVGTATVFQRGAKEEVAAARTRLRQHFAEVDRNRAGAVRKVKPRPL